MISEMESLIHTIGSAIGLSLVLILLRKLVPYKPPPGTHAYSLDLLRLEYARWDRIALALIVVITPLLGYIFFHILKTLATLNVGRFEGSPYVLLPF